jgi:hypothetical protein
MDRLLLNGAQGCVAVVTKRQKRVLRRQQRKRNLKQRRNRQRKQQEDTHAALRRRAVILQPGVGKDGSTAGPYVKAHPTNYNWRPPDVESYLHQLVNLPQFKGKIWANTYFQHPPEWNRDMTSYDIWGFGGRGDPLPLDVGAAVWSHIFNDESPPDIWWAIYRGRMWVRNPVTFQTWWEGSPPGPAGSDARHDYHIHITVLDWAAQVRLREW